jgi:signal transduction histidine kinase
MDNQPVTFRRADHGAKVLVVDDDALSRRSLRAMLERGRYQVETAEGGPQALAQLASYSPDLILLDIQMPEVDGLEVCQRIRQMPHGDLLPIIFLTGDERPDIHTLAFRAGGDDFLRKPVLSGELIVRIRSLMRLKRLQAEIQGERDSLLELQKQREQLFQFIVHDLKNPLSAIQVGLELLSERDDNTPAHEVQIRRLRDTGSQMGRMIQNILDIGQAEELGLELHKTRIQLSTWLPGLLQEMESQAHSKKHDLAWHCPSGLEIEADQDFLRRLLMNLVDNAMKYSPSGSHTRIEAHPTSDGVRLAVRDQGQGIPEHMREQVFEKFVRHHKGEVTTHSGSGIGLAFCKVVAEAHEGRIWVEANAPHGSLFVLEIPQALPA